jgi:dihydroflavonol-4-reductase
LKIFITGASGFIGIHLVKFLSGCGHELHCYVRATSDVSSIEHLPDVKLHLGDVRDREALLAGMRGCDWVFHLANLYAMWHPRREEFAHINITGTQTVMECALECEVTRVIHVSTIAVFGKPNQIPFNELAKSQDPLASEYARTKAAGDALVWEMYHQRGLPVTILYPGIVLGAGDDKASGQYIQDLIRRRLPSTIFHSSSGTYVYVQDVVQAIYQSAVRSDTIGKSYLIGKYILNGSSYARLISRVANVKLPLLHFPDWMVITAAYLLTGLSSITGRAPWWGLSIDAARTLKMGFQADGSKAEHDLGIIYTPIEFALAEAIKSYRD